jgi:hypothetical protein
MRGKMSSRISFGVSSQGITSATNFLTSICAIKFLDTGDFQKWFVYVVSTLAIQGVLRTTVLESDLIEFGSVGGKSKRVVFLVSLLPFALIPLINGYFKSAISELDFALAIYCALVLIQDATRYKYLGESPKLTLVSDTVWLSTIVVLFLLGVTVGDIDLYWFLGLSIVGPLLGCTVFLFFRKPEIEISRKTIEPLDDSQRGYLLAQSVFGTALTILTLFVLARYCTTSELKTIRIIQTIASPFYALAAGYWLTVVTSKPDDMDLNEILPRTLRNLFAYLVFLPMVLTGIYILGQKFDLRFFTEIISIAIIAISVPIINVITYPTNYILRLLRQYKIPMWITLIFSTFFFCSVVYTGETISAVLYFVLQFVSILAIQCLRLILCIQIRSSNREYKIMEENS